jgi:hypothetical protein
LCSYCTSWLRTAPLVCIMDYTLPYKF